MRLQIVMVNCTQPASYRAHSTEYYNSTHGEIFLSLNLPHACIYKLNYKIHIVTCIYSELNYHTLTSNCCQLHAHATASPKLILQHFNLKLLKFGSMCCSWPFMIKGWQSNLNNYTIIAITKIVCTLVIKLVRTMQ